MFGREEEVVSIESHVALRDMMLLKQLHETFEEGLPAIVRRAIVACLDFAEKDGADAIDRRRDQAPEGLRPKMRLGSIGRSSD